MQIVERAEVAAAEARKHQKTPKKTKGRGPARTRLRLMYYLLPENTKEAPRLTSVTDQAIVDMHHQCGFGKLLPCFETCPKIHTVGLVMMYFVIP